MKGDHKVQLEGGSERNAGVWSKTYTICCTRPTENLQPNKEGPYHIHSKLPDGDTSSRSWMNESSSKHGTHLTRDIIIVNFFSNYVINKKLNGLLMYEYFLKYLTINYFVPQSI